MNALGWHNCRNFISRQARKKKAALAPAYGHAVAMRDQSILPRCRSRLFPMGCRARFRAITGRYRT